MSLSASITSLRNLYKLYKLYKEVKKKMSEVKSGKKTSEMVVLIGNVVVMLVGTFAGKIPAATAAIIVATLSGLYIIGRSVVKLTATKADDIAIEKIGEVIKKLGGKLPD